MKRLHHKAWSHPEESGVFLMDFVRRFLYVGSYATSGDLCCAEDLGEGGTISSLWSGGLRIFQDIGSFKTIPDYAFAVFQINLVFQRSAKID